MSRIDASAPPTDAVPRFANDPTPSPLTPSVRVVAGLLVTNLVMQLAIILTGGAVRLTSSGLGCSQWPQCEPGSMSPVHHAESTYHPYVEFGNRLLSVLVVVIAVVAFVAVWRHRRNRSRAMLWLAAAPALGVLVQAGMGGMTVLLSLHPAVVGFHFLISGALVWVSTWALIRWRRGDQQWRSVGSSPVPGLAIMLAVLMALIVALGVVVTGAGPHSGDDETGYRFAVDPLLMSRLHAGAVWLFLGVLVLYAAALRRQRRAHQGLESAYRSLGWVTAAVLAQGGLGYWQFFTGLPELLVGAHMVGSGLVILAVTAALLQLRQPVHRGADQVAAAPH